MVRLPLSPRTSSSFNSSNTTSPMDNKVIKSKPTSSSSHSLPVPSTYRHQHQQCHQYQHQLQHQYGHHSSSSPLKPMPSSLSPKHQLIMARYKRNTPPLSPKSLSGSSPGHHSTNPKGNIVFAVKNNSFNEAHHHRDKLDSPSMPMSGHVKSIRSTIEKKVDCSTSSEVHLSKKCYVNNKGKESIIILHRQQQEQLYEVKSITIQSAPQSFQQQHQQQQHRFVPNMNSPTWKSIQQHPLTAKKTCNEMISSLSQMNQELQNQTSPTFTVSSSVAVASVASGDGDSHVNVGGSSTTHIVGEFHSEDNKVEEDSEEIVSMIRQKMTAIALAMDDRAAANDTHLAPPSSFLSSVYNPSSPSSTCSSVNWDVLEKLLGGSSSADSDEDGDIQGVKGRGEDRNTKSKVRLLAELVGSNVPSTSITTKESNEEHVKGKVNKQKKCVISKEEKQKTKEKRRSSREKSTQTLMKQQKQYPGSLLVPYLHGSDRSSMISLDSTDLVIQTVPSSVTTASSRNSRKFQADENDRDSNKDVSRTKISVDATPSFSSSSSYSSSSLVYSLGETIQSSEQQQQGQLLLQRSLKHLTPTEDTLVDAAPRDEKESMKKTSPTSHNDIVQMKDVIHIEDQINLAHNDDCFNKNGNCNSGNNNNKTNENDPVAKLLASTLAECRLLLEMSPPPTPMYHHPNSYPKVANDNTHIVAQEDEELPQLSATTKLLTSAHLLMQSLKSQSRKLKDINEKTDHEEAIFCDEEIDTSGVELEYVDNKDKEHVDEEKATEEEDKCPLPYDKDLIPDGNSDLKANDRSPTSLTEFLTCPACSIEFSEEDESLHQPLHSFACDHIVCRACVYNTFSHIDDGCNDSTVSTMVFCPECGQDGAFDIRRPIVSRAYQNLVRKMKNTGRSISSNDGVCNYSNNGVDAERTSQLTDRHKEKAVPRRICVPSPTSSRLQNHLSRCLEDEHIVKDDTEDQLNVEIPGNLEVLVPPKSTFLNDKDDMKQERLIPNTQVSFDNNYDHQQPIQDVNTPISRAQLLVVQRREKLVQSLDRVNMILERSKALTVPETPAGGDGLTLNVIDDGGELFEWENNVFQTAPSGIKNRCKSGLRVDTGNHALLLSSWSSPPSFGEADNTKRNEEVENNTNSSAPNELSTLMDDQQLVLFSPGQFPHQTALPPVGGHDISGIFKPVDIEVLDHMETDTKSESINFFSRSATSESPTAEGKDETLPLLPSNQTIQPSSVDEQGTKLQKSSKFKAYCFDSLTKGGNATTSSSPRTLLVIGGKGIVNKEKEHETCPQFLPSLNYSIMNESDEYAGFVAETPKNIPSKPLVFPSKSISSNSGAKGEINLPKIKFSSSSEESHRGAGIPSKPVQQLVSWSFDDECFHQLASLQKQENGGSMHPNSDVLQDVNKENQVYSVPTYDFSMHSCSLSPSTNEYDDDNDNDDSRDDAQQHHRNGRSLVTHKPRRLHKKIIATFRGGSATIKSRKMSRAG